MGDDVILKRSSKVTTDPWLLVSIKEEMMYRKLTMARRTKCTYASDQLTILRDNQDRLRLFVGQRYKRLTETCSFPYAADHVALQYSSIRKGNYRQLRDGKSILEDWTNTLFPDMAPKETSVVLYAYAINLPDHGGWCVKIGYTTKPVRSYIKGQAHPSVGYPLAFRRGTIADEQRIHKELSAYLIHGAEYYAAAEPLYRELSECWDDPEMCFEDMMKRFPPNNGKVA